MYGGVFLYLWLSTRPPLLLGVFLDFLGLAFFSFQRFIDRMFVVCRSFRFVSSGGSFNGFIGLEMVTVGVINIFIERMLLPFVPFRFVSFRPAVSLVLIW